MADQRGQQVGGGGNPLSLRLEHGSLDLVPGGTFGVPIISQAFWRGRPATHRYKIRIWCLETDEKQDEETDEDARVNLLFEISHDSNFIGDIIDLETGQVLATSRKLRVSVPKPEKSKRPVPADMKVTVVGDMPGKRVFTCIVFDKDGAAIPEFRFPEATENGAALNAATDLNGAFTHRVDFTAEDKVLIIIAGPVIDLQYTQRFEKPGRVPPSKSWLDPLRRLNR